MHDFDLRKEKNKLVCGNPMTRDSQKRSTTEPQERQNRLISVNPLKIEIPDKIFLNIEHFPG